jgi:hypothetical protein
MQPENGLMNAKQLDLFDEVTEARLYHETESFGYFSILSKQELKVQQSSHALTLLPTVIELLPKDRDTWLSQAEFIRANRRVVNLLRIGLAFVDLDTYRTDYRHIPPESIAQSLAYYCDDHNIPQPSVILFSGRGLQAKWLFEKAIPDMPYRAGMRCKRPWLMRSKILAPIKKLKMPAAYCVW